MDQSTSEHRSRLPWGTLFFGSLLGSGVLAAIHWGPFQGTVAQRYVSHPVEGVEVLMFGCALAAFAGKYWRSRIEHRALKLQVLPAWDGRPVPVSEAVDMLCAVQQFPVRIQRTLIARRISAVLQYVARRNTANGLDDHLRTLSDNDALTLESSYSLTRFITWAIPILGFLGTVLGITEAIAGVTPEVLEQSLSSVTDGLALAFDSTALGLGLTMAAMFINFLVERAEWGALEAVDQHVEQQLSHRFEREAETSQFSSEMFREIVEPIVRRQADIWAETLAEVNRRHADEATVAEQKLSGSLERAMERTLEAHAVRMKELEKQTVNSGSAAVERLAGHARAVCDAGKEQQQALAKLVQGVAAHVQALGRLQSNSEQLIRLQETLDRNLSAVTAAGTLDQAVHSLTAAIHLLTSRAETARKRDAA
jgi:biopolymer transport protein ExbB/TolQ